MLRVAETPEAKEKIKKERKNKMADFYATLEGKTREQIISERPEFEGYQDPIPVKNGRVPIEGKNFERVLENAFKELDYTCVLVIKDFDNNHQEVFRLDGNLKESFKVFLQGSFHLNGKYYLR